MNKGRLRLIAKPPLIHTRCLREKIGDRLRDPRYNGRVEDERDSREQQRAQDHGDDDFYGVADIEIAALI